MKAQDFLDQLKKQIPPTTGIGQSEAFQRKYANTPADIFEKASAMRENYGAVLSEPVIQVMTASERDRLGHTMVATLPLEAINARTYKVDNSEYLIAVNDRLLALIFTWGELQIIPLVTTEIILDNFAQIFAPVIDCYLTPNSNSALPIFSFEQIPEKIVPGLVFKSRCAEQFIVAHELAHIVLGHLENAKSLTFHQEAYSFNAEAYNIEQQKEFDADVQALKWMKKSLEEQGLPDKLIFFCVEVFVLFHYIESNLGFPKKTGSHPSALSRLMNLQKHFPDVPEIANMVKNCKDIASFRISRD